jgi:mRNA-degrading endonuclease YafQ of YafQ-DinJ toxin-antitoxin module
MITRENYEEFFLLYVDNELSAAARSAVERFVDEHPDLREEWEAFRQCRVQPDEDLVFPFTHELLKEEHEDMLLSYVDGELDAKDRAAVDDLIGRQPSTAIELRHLLLTVSEPDRSIVFKDKESLYRTERRRRVEPLFWMRAGVAAAVLTAGAFLFLNRPHGKESLPVVRTDKKDGGPVTPHTATPLYPEKARASAQMVKQEMNRTASATVPDKKSVKRSSRDVAVKTDPLKDGPVVSPISTTDTGSRNVVITAVTTPDKTDALPVVNTLAVSIPKDQSSFATQALLKETQDNAGVDIFADAPAPPGKTKLRRIFRRVSRAFGKTADRDDDGQRQVLISAFQVALK